MILVINAEMETMLTNHAILIKAGSCHSNIIDLMEKILWILMQKKKKKGQPDLTWTWKNLE